MSDIKEPIHPLKALDETNPIFASPTLVFTSAISYDFLEKRTKFPPRGGVFPVGDRRQNSEKNENDIKT